MSNDASGHAFKVEALSKADEPVFRKHANRAFIRSELERCPRATGIEALAVVGMATGHCVSTTIR